MLDFYRNSEANTLMFMLKIIITRREKTQSPKGQDLAVRCFLRVRGCVTACKGHCLLLEACTLAWLVDKMKTRMQYLVFLLPLSSLHLRGD